MAPLLILIYLTKSSYHECFYECFFALDYFIYVSVRLVTLLIPLDYHLKKKLVLFVSLAMTWSLVAMNSRTELFLLQLRVLPKTSCEQQKAHRFPIS